MKKWNVKFYICKTHVRENSIRLAVQASFGLRSEIQFPINGTRQEP